MTERVFQPIDSENDELTWKGLWSSVRGLWARFGHLASDPALVATSLAAILLLAGILRFTGLDWDEHQHLHPDERFLTMVENSLEWPQSFREYLNTDTNPLNPYNKGHGTYVYGLSPLVLAKFVGQVTGMQGYDGVYLAGRAMSAVMDMICVLLVFLIGRRLYDARVGLLGALLLSLTVLNIQHSHFFTVDMATTLFVTLALYLAVRVAQGSGWGSIALLGVAFGLAVSAKISVLTFLAVIGLAYMLRIAAQWKHRESAWSTAQGQISLAGTEMRGRLGQWFLSVRVEPNPLAAPNPAEAIFWLALRAIFSGIVVVLIALVVFRVVQPQAFVGPRLLDFSINPKWREDMKYIQELVSGKIDYPPSHQWAGREPIWYAWKNMVLWGLGLPLGLAVWGSWALMAYEMYRKRVVVHLLPWVWMSLTFFYQSIQFVKTIRYLLPIYPTMAVIAAYGLVRLWDWGQRQAASARAPAALASAPPETAVGAGDQPAPFAAKAAIWAPFPSRGFWRRVARPLSMSLVLVVVLGTAFWALAFTSIYTRPVTRITASRWIYNNLPSGTRVSFEVWDDAVPMNIDGHNGSLEYPGVRMDLYWEDIPEKREELYNWLQEAEIIALTSNRLYESIPRLPQRYPMTTRYYEALFSGELGFERIATFTSRPRLFGIEIVDDYADETFTVYDHPKVILFRKTSAFSIEKARQLFDGYELERIVRVTPLQVTKAPNNLMLREDQWAIQRQGGTWSSTFRRDGLANTLPLLAWALALWLIGLIAFPLGFVAFRRLRDRGYLLSKTLGLLLLAYFSWLLASLKVLPYTRATIAGVLGLLLVISAVVAWAQRGALRMYLVQRWRMLVASELLFWAFFGAFVLIRVANPDLWHPAMGGEKPMDLAYLNAIIKSTYFPPYDPWFAGGYINYYYYGAVVVATIVKLTGVVPWVAYNLAIPTFFALTALGAACVAFNLIPDQGDEERWFPRALGYGLVGALLVAVLGNLGEVRLLWNGFRELGQNAIGGTAPGGAPFGGGQPFSSTIPGLSALVQAVAGVWVWLAKGQALPFRPEWWYWNASRIMQNGEINEFPFFTFLYADLHAHLTAMPFALLALGLATALVVRPVPELAGLARDASPARSGSGKLRLWQRVDWAQALQLGLLALAVGELWCNNTWDYPTYLFISVIALGIGLYGETQRIDRPTIGRFIFRAAAILVLSILFYYPYHANFGSGYSSVELWKGERTPLGAYLLIHGLQLFIFVSLLLSWALDRRTTNGVARAIRLWLKADERRPRFRHLYSLLVRRQTLGYDLAWTGLVCLGIVLLTLLISGAWLLLLGMPLLILAVLLTVRRAEISERRFESFLIALGLALTLIVEYIVLKGDIGRMNTVFKFYLQVWMLWGVAAAVALAHLLRRTKGWSATARQFWSLGLGILLVGAALYPVLATYGKVRDRWNPDVPKGLNGMAYMAAAEYQDNGRIMMLEHDRQAITWMQDHIAGSPVIAEANTPLYRWGNRISIYTGLPTIIGWDWHQKQQRAALSGEVVDWRLQDLNEIYNGTDVVRAVQLLDRYHASYIYVGELEQAYYAPEGLAKFDTMVGSSLEIVYRQGPVTIYRVVGSDGRELADTKKEGRGLVADLWDWIARRWIGGAVRAQDPAASSPAPQKAPSGNSAFEPAEKTLMLDRPVDQLPVLNDRGWNRWASRSTIMAIVTWWVVLQLVGLAAWPLAARYLRGFADRGYGLAKGLGLLLVSYAVWMGASLRLVANSPPVAWGVLLLLGVTCFFLYRRQRPNLHSQAAASSAWWPVRRLILLEEGLFTAAFLAFVGIRVWNPDLWQPWFGGEKMMEIAFLNAIVKSAHMPPYDPYFAGGYINYYYYGLLITNVLAKLTGIVPEVAFNLAVPTFFALTIQHAFVVGYHLFPVFRTLGISAGSVPVGTLSSGGVTNPAGITSIAPVAPISPGLREAVRVQAAVIVPRVYALREPAWIGATPIVPLSRADQQEQEAIRPLVAWTRAPLWAGVLAAAWVAILGNLSAIVQLVDGLARLGGATFTIERPIFADLARVFSGLWLVLSGQGAWPAFDYWYRSTRIIPFTINEFPFFSFLFADLHPHMIAIPFAILAVALGLHLVLDTGHASPAMAQRPSDSRGSILSLWRWPILALVLGALGVINTWDLPSYLLVLGACLLVRGYRLRGSKGTLEALIIALLIALASVLFYAPFYAHFRAQYVGLGLVAPAERSPLGDFLVVWGSQLFLLLSLLLFWVARDWPWRRLARAARRASWPEALDRMRRLSQRGLGLWVLVVLGLALAVVLFVMFSALQMGVVALLSALLLVAGVSLLRGCQSRSLLSRILLFVGLGILLGVECIYLRDFLAGGEWRRMNTVFKFFTQAWILFGLAIGGALPALWAHLSRRVGAGAALWKPLVVVFTLAALLYPLQGIPARANERFPGASVPAGTLDGTAYMATASYAWPDESSRIDLRYDREAIVWLWGEARGTPVIAEASLGYYREGGMRVSSYTGLPTIVGMHESEQRPSAGVYARDADVSLLYTTTDLAQLEDILSRYRVTYIYVGQLERRFYAGPGLDKFDAAEQTGLLARAFHNDKVDIYRVLREWGT